MAGENKQADDKADFAHTLSKPIKAHGEELTEVKFRKPVGLDIITVGNPVIFDMNVDPPSVSHDWKVMPAMISRLAAIPNSSVASMEPGDLIACAWLLTPFFVPSLD